MDEIQISYVVHLLHQAVFGIVGGWGDLCPADRGLVLWGIAGRTSHPSGVPDYDLLLCGTRPISASVCLHRLLRNLRRERVFEQENVTLLRAISWLCIAVGVVTLVSGFYYTSFFLVAAAAAFCGLIVRVVKNVFEQAIEIKTENDYTI